MYLLDYSPDVVSSLRCELINDEYSDVERKLITMTPCYFIYVLDARK